MERHNDAYGTCPRCEYVGWHKYKKKAIIFGDGKRKYKVSLFKCPKCGKKFGFELGGGLPVATAKSTARYHNGIQETRNINYSSYYKPQKEEKKDEFDEMLEALSNDYDKDEPEHYKITPNELIDIVNQMDKIINCVDHGNLDANTGGSILHSVAGIRKVIQTVTNRG